MADEDGVGFWPVTKRTGWCGEWEGRGHVTVGDVPEDVVVNHGKGREPQEHGDGHASLYPGDAGEVRVKRPDGSDWRAEVGEGPLIFAETEQLGLYQVEVDGVLYLRVVDPVKASYGIDNYKYATAQLAQTTMRSAIGKLELDRTFEERGAINAEIVLVVI